MVTTQSDVKHEHHPDWYHDIPVMKTLILGSFPPHESKRDFQFYYPNKQNNFWKILAALAKTELKYMTGANAVAERKRIMEKLKVGVENMGKTIQRKGTSARDTDIAITEFHDIEKILSKHKELARIILAGYSAQHSTYSSFCSYLNQRKIKFTVPKKIKPGASFLITYNKKQIECIICNSTSTATRISLKTLIDQFSNYIIV